MNVSPVQSPVDMSRWSPEQLKDNSAVADKTKVNELSRQFEAVLVRQILGEAFTHRLHPGFGGSQTVDSIYQDMINYQLGEAISQSRTVGLAQALEKQLSHQLQAEPQDDPAGETPSSLLPLPQHDAIPR